MRINATRIVRLSEEVLLAHKSFKILEKAACLGNVV